MLFMRFMVSLVSDAKPGAIHILQQGMPLFWTDGANEKQPAIAPYHSFEFKIAVLAEHYCTTARPIAPRPSQ